MPNDRFLTAYVDLPFLRKLFREKPEDLSTTPDDDWPMVWQNVYRFLQRSANIVVGAEEDVVRSDRALARFLFGGGFYRHVEFHPELPGRYADPGSVDADEHPFSVFLMESPEVPTDMLRERKGLLFLQVEDLTTHWPQLCSEHVLNVLPSDGAPHGHSFEWEDLKGHADPLNTIVIADKYAYRQFRSGSYEENLGELLLALLPGTLDDPVHLTLVTDLKTSLAKDFEPPADEDWPHPKDIREEIRDHLEEKRPELDLRLGVVGYSDEGHKDRFIFTNYGLFTSNDSFSFFKDGRLNKETLVTYLPNSTRGAEVVKPRLQRMAKRLTDLGSFNAAVYDHGPDDMILLADGDDKNRLLRAV